MPEEILRELVFPDRHLPLNDNKRYIPHPKIIAPDPAFRYSQRTHTDRWTIEEMGTMSSFSGSIASGKRVYSPLERRNSNTSAKKALRRR